MIGSNGEAAARIRRLTRREREVFARCLADQTTAEVARDLGITDRTVQHHRRSILNKLGVATSAGMAIVALAAWERMGSQPKRESIERDGN